MIDWVSVSPGMQLRSRENGHQYTIEAVRERHVTVESPSGTLTVDRSKVEAQIRACNVVIERWP